MRRGDNNEYLCVSRSDTMTFVFALERQDDDKTTTNIANMNSTFDVTCDVYFQGQRSKILIVAEN